MSTHYHRLIEFFKELKRRKVLRVITVYAASAFVILELVDILAPSLGLPDWTLNLVLLLLCVGFVIAVIVSWIYDIHPEEGIVKTKPAHKVKSENTPKSSNSWRIASYISFVVIVGLILFNLISTRLRSRDIQKLDKTLAVIPFENWTTLEEFPYLGDAIANEINTQLAKVKQFHVYSYTSSKQFKGPEKPSIPQIGRELGANFIIEGSVERQDQNVSIHVQVIRADKDDHIWANEFRGKWEDLFSFRAQIAIMIAEELKTILSPDEIRKIQKNPTKHADEAYDYFLMGINAYETHLDFEKAADYFKHVIQLDSSSALAYTYLAQCYQFISRYSMSYLDSYEEAHAKAMEAALKAYQLDPMLGEALAVYGLILAEDWEIYTPEDLFRRAIQLSPGSSEVYSSFAQYLRWLGRYEESILYAKKALELDPLNPMSYQWLAVFHTFSGQIEQSNKMLEKAFELNPRLVPGFFVQAINYVYEEKYDKAYAIVKQLFSEDSTLVLSAISGVYVTVAPENEARKFIAYMLELSEKQFVDPVFFAMAYYALEEYEAAFEYLEQAVEIHSGQTIYLRAYADLVFPAISSDYRYIKILESIGFKMK